MLSAMTWREKSVHIYNLHEKHASEQSSWGMAQTSELVSLGAAITAKYYLLGKALKNGIVFPSNSFREAIRHLSIIEKGTLLKRREPVTERLLDLHNKEATFDLLLFSNPGSYELAYMEKLRNEKSTVIVLCDGEHFPTVYAYIESAVLSNYSTSYAEVLGKWILVMPRPKRGLHTVTHTHTTSSLIRKVLPKVMSYFTALVVGYDANEIQQNFLCDITVGY